jgi:hypothetical protein
MDSESRLLGRVRWARRDDIRSSPRRCRGPQASGRQRHSVGAFNAVRPLLTYLRKNPQVLALLVICLVLGIGTFLIVLFSLISSGSMQITGEPSGTVVLVSDRAPARSGVGRAGVGGSLITVRTAYVARPRARPGL